jgi:hypothetical protein
MKTLLSIFFVSLFLTGCSQKPTIIKKFTPYYYANQVMNDTIEIGKKARFDHFIISNYKDNIKTEKIIDSFINFYKDINWAKYYQYSIFFFKESKYLNETLLAENPRLFDKQEAMNCLVYTYSWSKGTFIEKVKLEDGEEIKVFPKRKGSITMEEVQPSKK